MATNLRGALIVLVACGLESCSAEQSAPGSTAHWAATAVQAVERPAAPALRPSMDIAAHMRDHHDWADGIRHALVRGNVAAARRMGSELVEHDWEPRLVEFDPLHLEAMRAAAHDSAKATTLQSAAEALGRLATACGGCHRDLGVIPRFRVVPRPAENPDLKSRMALHEWAADRLWEGLIGPIDPSWRQGAEALRGSSLCAPSDSARRAGDKPVSDGGLGSRLDELVHQAPKLETVPDRGAWYAGFVTTCVKCHEVGCAGGTAASPEAPGARPSRG